jgi:hypothetical protein
MTRRTRLSVCLLEGREAPGTLEVSNLIAASPAGGAPGRAGINVAPVITDFRAVVGPNGQVTFTGSVSDDTPVAGYVVRITGPGVNVSAIVLRDGTFSVTTIVTGTTDVTVSAQTTDAAGARSDPVYTTFLPSG